MTRESIGPGLSSSFQLATENARGGHATWKGQRVLEASVPIGTLAEQLPRFSRSEFGLNRFMDVVYREPWDGDARGAGIPERFQSLLSQRSTESCSTANLWRR